MAEIDVTSESKTKKKVIDVTKENPVFEYEVGEDKENSRGIQYPDQDIPESEKDANYYIDNIHYISTFYNVSLESILVPVANNDSSPGVPTGLLNPRDLPVNRMLKNMTYYQGKQENYEYADWASGGSTSGNETSNVVENNYQPHWIKGQDIAELLNFMKGNMLERIVNLQITAKALSEEAESEKQEYRTKLLAKSKFGKMLSSMNPPLEIPVGPPEGLNSEQAIDEFMQKNFKQRGVPVAIAMAKDVWVKQHGLHQMLDAFLKCLITGTAQIQQYVQNGKLLWRYVPSWQMIFDTRHDDEYNRDAQFIGIVETMTPTEIFSRFPQLSKEQRDEIKRMARTKDIGVKYNAAFSNFLWWNYNVKRDECVVAVVTSYWIGRHDMGLKKDKDKFDNDRIRKTGKGEGGEYILDDIYKGTLIGNRYLVDWGLDDNIVEDTNDKSKPLFPIIRYMPNMVGGEPRSVVSRLSDMQDEIDALSFKIRETIGKSKGKCYAIVGDIGNNTNTQEIWKDLSAMGLTVIPHSGEGDARTRLVESIDLTADPWVNQWVAIVKDQRALMKEYTSVSNVSLGMQTSYMGMGERSAAIGQSSYGLASLYHGFMDFIQMNLQYAINVQKNLLTMDENDTEAAFVLGNEGVAYLKVMKELRFEDFLIILQLNDVLDDQKKKDLQGLALAWAQNNIIDPPAYLKVLKQETYTGAEKVLEVEVNKKKKEAIQQREAERQHEQQLGQQQAEGLQKAEILRQSGQDNREHVAAEAKKDVALINNSGKDKGAE